MTHFLALVVSTHNAHLIKVLDKTFNRFEVPDTSDTGRWTNRVVNNLIYYQTNYFVSALIVFSLIRLLQIPFESDSITL